MRRSVRYIWDDEKKKMVCIGERKIRPRIEGWTGKPTKIRTVEGEPTVNTEQEYYELCRTLEGEHGIVRKE